LLIFVELFLQELMSDGHVRNCQTTSKKEDERYGQFIAVTNVEWQVVSRWGDVIKRTITTPSSSSCGETPNGTERSTHESHL